MLVVHYTRTASRSATALSASIKTTADAAQIDRFLALYRKTGAPATAANTDNEVPAWRWWVWDAPAISTDALAPRHAWFVGWVSQLYVLARVGDSLGDGFEPAAVARDDLLQATDLLKARIVADWVGLAKALTMAGLTSLVLGNLLLVWLRRRFARAAGTAAVVCVALAGLAARCPLARAGEPIRPWQAEARAQVELSLDAVQSMISEETYAHGTIGSQARVGLRVYRERLRRLAELLAEPGALGSDARAQVEAEVEATMPARIAADLGIRDPTATPEWRMRQLGRLDTVPVARVISASHWTEAEIALLQLTAKHNLAHRGQVPGNVASLIVSGRAYGEDVWNGKAVAPLLK